MMLGVKMSPGSKHRQGAADCLLRMSCIVLDPVVQNQLACKLFVEKHNLLMGLCMHCQNSKYLLGVVQASGTCPGTASPLLESSFLSAFSCPCSGQFCTKQQFVLFCFLPSACTCQCTVTCLQVPLAHLVVHRQCIKCHVCHKACAWRSSKLRDTPFFRSLHKQLLYTLRSNQQENMLSVNTPIK